ncbi:MAG: hypothetical protein OQK04_02795, partial [Kangiellaceae bacterium]|nr:hypothetical protein [Kangiellaceae bacterium]
MKNNLVRIFVVLTLALGALLVWRSSTIEEEFNAEPNKAIEYDGADSSVRSNTNSNTESASSLAESKPQLDNTNHYQLGLDAANRAKNKFVSEIGLYFVDDSAMYDLLKQGSLSELYIAALSNTDSPKAHFYMAMVELSCEINQMNIQFNQQQANMQPPENGSIPPETEEFYDGIEEGSQQLMSGVESECIQVSTMKENNQEFIEGKFLELFGKKSFKELFGSIDDSKESAERFFELTDMQPSELLNRNLSFEFDLKSKDEQVKNQAYKDLVSSSLDSPDFFLVNKTCSYHSDCKKAIGNEDYLKYIEAGAFLGVRGTLDNWTRELSKQQRFDEELAWLKYQRDLIRLGCTYGNIRFDDMRVSNQIRILEEKLNDSQHASGETIY